MYFYIFDSFLNKKKFSKTVAKIETRIVDLGIDGKIVKLSVLKSMPDLVKGAIEKGAKTIVVVGNDKTVNQIINIIADEDITLGFIPVGPENKMASLLGIPLGELACDVLSSRLIEKIDLGKINGQYFLSSLAINDNKIVLNCDKNYQIIPSPHCKVFICNFGSYFNRPSNPKDGVLEAVISRSPNKLQSLFKPAKQENSLFFNRKIEIKSTAKDEKPVPILVDEAKIIKTPAMVEIAPKKMKIIVGKKRIF